MDSEAKAEIRSSASVTPADRTWLWRLLRKLALSLLLGALFAWIVARGGVPLLPPRHAFATVSWGMVAFYPATVLGMHFLRASRWRHLIAPVRRLPLREVVALNWVGFFAIFALPFRLGEFARPSLTKIRHGISVSTGLGTVAVERVVDGLMTSFCVAWALLVLPRPHAKGSFAVALPVYGYLALVVFGGAFLALALLLWKRELAALWIRRLVGWLSPRLGELVADKVQGVADGIRSIGDVKLAAAFVFETLLYWCVNALGMWLLARGCGLPLDFGHAVALMGILAIGILLPAGPGLFGNFQLAVGAALQLYFAESLVAQQGAVYVFLLYGIQAVVVSVAGIVPLYAMRVSPRRLLAV